MKWNDENVKELKKLCVDGISNKDIAKELGCTVTEIYGKRSALGITIPKVKAGTLEGGEMRTVKEIEIETYKVRKARGVAELKIKRCDERLSELEDELDGAMEKEKVLKERQFQTSTNLNT